MHLITSKTGRDGSIPINQEADLFVAKLKPGESLKHSFAEGRSGWLQVIDGELEIDGQHLSPGDAAAVTKENALVISATKPAHFLFFDLN